MKQKHLHILVVLVALLLVPANSWADDLKRGDTFEVDGITYRVTDIYDKTVNVGPGGWSSSNDPAIDVEKKGSLVIPANVTGPDGKEYVVNQVASYAFRNCTGLSSITLPNTIESISSYAFYGCTGLTSFKFPEKVDRISSLSFYGCSSLTSVAFPSALKEIGSLAFSKCSSLATFTIPESVLAIENAAFKDTKWYENQPKGLLYKDNVLLGYKDDKPNGRVVVKANTRVIAGRAFDGCKELTSITFPIGLVSIGTFAFYNCSGLTSITIPKSVMYCGEIWETTYGGNPFINCSGLTKIVVESGSATYDSRDNCNAIIEKKRSMLVTGCKNTVVPDGVRIIDSNSFTGCTGLTSISIPKSVGEIGSAFDGCTGLKEVKSINNDPKSIRSNSFPKEVLETATLYVPTGTKDKYSSLEGWKGFKTIVETNMTVPSYLMPDDRFTAGGMECKVLSIFPFEVEIGTGKTYRAAIDKNTSGSFTIPSSVKGPDGNKYSVTALGSYSFYGCEQLTSVVIPNTVISIGSNAFCGCVKLTAVNIPKSVTEIVWGPFSYCHALATITVDAKNPVFDSRDKCNAIIHTATNKLIQGCPKTTIPQSVTAIGSAAFEGFNGLTSITIPSSITEIEEYAINYCDDITSMVVDPANPVFDSREGCNAIIKTATNELVQGCNVTVIPNSVTAIGVAAFRGCRLMTSMPIPESVKAIGSEAFCHCFELLSANIPNGVTEIPHEAFFNCMNLKSIVIPNTVTSIGSYAFNACYDLTTLTLGSSIKTIAYNAFYMTSLSKIYSLIEEPSDVKVYSEVFDSNVYEDALLYVPAGTKAKYQTTEAWSKFENIIDEGDTFSELSVEGAKMTFMRTGSDSKICELISVDESAKGTVTIPNTVKDCLVTSIGTYAFMNCTNVTAINIPNSVNSIERTAFYNCSGLLSITLPNSVSSIGSAAFSGCTNLATVKLPNKIISLESGTFYECSSLTSIVIPNGVTTIGGRAISMCTSLKELTIGKSVTSIGSSAFWGNKSLKKVISMIKEPFAVDSSSFMYYDEDTEQRVFTSATLYVPAGTKAKYEATDGWKEFKNIVEMEPEKPYEVKDDGTAIVKNLVPDENGQLVIPEKVDIDGKEYPVTEIAPEAFMDNKDLVEVTIPGTVTTIGADAFAGCGNLRAIYLMSTTPIALSQAAVRGVIRRADGTTVSQFDGVDYETCVLYVPYGCGEAYRNAEGWKLFKHIVEMEDTGINGAALNDKGQMINDKWYDLKGRCISQPKKGVNILRDGNGKTKVVVIK